MDTSEIYIKMCEKAGFQGPWLPRQDQLQEMVNWEKIFIVREGKEYQQRSLGDILLRANSMEQLWLAFVMKEKFNKEWDGKEWKAKIDKKRREVISN